MFVFPPLGGAFRNPATLTINGRLVSNPLATTTRFYYATRGEGQLWTPWLIAWNARIGREFRLNERSSFEVVADVFNITNRGAAQHYVTGGNQINSSNYGGLQNIQTPRSAQFSVRWNYKRVSEEGKMNRRAVILIALIAFIAAAHSVRTSAIEPARLTLEDLASVEGAQSPSLAPDGKWFALSWQGQIVLVSSGGGWPAPLTSTPGGKSGLDWSPDGKS
ncbi:MAG: hypothetical protein J2P52_16705, partial [Blastocatellia bacterium]|nr:hypothetical protein [Blastocatellia bacterium]